MGGLELRVTGSRFLPGYAFGLAERTALIEIDCVGADGFDAAAEARVREAFWELCPEERIYALPGCRAGDLPGALLIEADAEPVRADPLWRLGRWVVALTVALHRWAHLPVVQGRVVHAEGGSLWLALPWLTERMLDSALELALRLLAAWAGPDTASRDRESVEAEFRSGLENLHHESPPVEWLRFAQAAAARGMPFDAWIDCLRIGWAAHAVYLDSTFTVETSHLGHRIAKNKARTNEVLAAAGAPVPKLRVASSLEEARQAAADLGWPVVVKPIAQDLSRGVVTGIRSDAQLRDAFDEATEHGSTVVVEKHVDGDSFRLLVVHGRLLAAIRRVPAGVTGDGRHSIAELMEIANTDPSRRTYLKPLKLDDEGLAFIADQGFDANSVPDPGRHVPFAHLTFRKIGGSAEDVWDLVHPDNRMLAERVAAISHLDIAGVDLITTDISRSWRETGAVVCEVNSQPALTPHWLAQPEREIHGEIIDILYRGRSATVPTAAVIGAGSAEAAALLHGMWTAAGVLAGMASTRGVLIGHEVVGTEDSTGHAGARTVLNNPTVQAAVFEVAPAALLESGHGCDHYAVAAVLSATGADADPAASVLELAGEAVVLNADDPGCWAIRTRARAARQILLAADPSVTAEHRHSGGAAVFPDPRDRRTIVIAEGEEDVARFALHDPATDLTAAMCAAALAWSQGVNPDAIAEVL